MLLYRIVKERFANQVGGEGARALGGRWNSPGRPMIYTATTKSLALLQILVHSVILPEGMVVVTYRLPARTGIKKLSVDDLPAGWDSQPHSQVGQRIGDDFLIDGKSLALMVPSVIIPTESNVLLNPLHRYAERIVIEDISKLVIDSRLK